MTKLKVFDADIEMLRPNTWNTNVVSPENEEKIKNSIERFGFFRPILVRDKKGDLEIIGGEHRWAVAKGMGLKTIPVVNLGEISDKKAKEIGLVDNSRYGDDDAFQLADLLKELGEDDDILTFLPYSPEELENLFETSAVSLDELEIDDDGLIPDMDSLKSTQTHQIMRFKVPIEDVDHVQRMVESTMRTHGYTKDDSMMNAGHALVHILRSAS